MGQICIEFICKWGGGSKWFEPLLMVNIFGTTQGGKRLFRHLTELLASPSIFKKCAQTHVQRWVGAGGAGAKKGLHWIVNKM